MSETTVVCIVGALLGVIELLTTVVIGCVAYELRQLRTAMESKVSKEDCTIGMCRHETEIRELWKNTHKNTEKIVKIEAERKGK